MNKLIKKYVYKKKETEKRKKKYLEIIDEYNENKNEEIEVRNSISRNIILLISNVLTSFSEGYIQGLLNDLEYLNNLLEASEYKENETMKSKNSLLKIIQKARK